MNRIKAVLSAAVAALAVSGYSANAATLAEVGSADTLLEHAEKAELELDSNSGISLAEEEAWVSSVLGYAVTISYKDNDTASSWEVVDGDSDLYAHDLGSTPEFYILKLGTSDSGSDDYYLYRNLAEFQWAVISLSEIAGIFDQTCTDRDDYNDCSHDFNFGRVSHISNIGNVPLPGTLGLLGLGLAGLGAVRRRKA